MKEIIAHNLNVSLDDSLLSTIEDCVVEKDALAKFYGMDLTRDTLFLEDGNFFKREVPKSDFNALVYLFIKNGSSCCNIDVSGQTVVSARTSRTFKAPL